MREGSPVNGNVTDFNTAEHIMRNSSTGFGSVFELIREKATHPTFNLNALRDARLMALIPLVILVSYPTYSPISQEIYSIVSMRRHNKYFEGQLVLFNEAYADDGALIAQQVWIPPLVDVERGLAENRWEVRAVHKEENGSFRHLPDKEVDKLALQKEYSHVFELLPRENEEDFRVLRLRMNHLL